MKRAFLSLIFLAGIGYSGVCDFDLKTHLPNIPPSAEVVEKREVHGLCEIVVSHPMGEVIFYGKKDFLILGNMIVKGRDITSERISKRRSALFKKHHRDLEKLVGLTYGKGKGQSYFYFISDPDCPYCQAVKRGVRELADKHRWTVKVVWYPLPIHPGADKKAESFICEKKTYDDYIKDNWGSKECKEGKEKVKKALELLQKLRIGGTPTFIFPDGSMVMGADLDRLEHEIIKRKKDAKKSG